MNRKLKKLLHDLGQNPEYLITEAQIKNVQNQLSFDLPSDYIEVIREFNGGEGEIGEDGWLCLIPIQKLIATNKNYYFLMNQIPDYFLFAKDAADTGFAFHKMNQTYHSFGLMSNFETDFIRFCGNNFLEFVEDLGDNSRVDPSKD